MLSIRRSARASTSASRASAPLLHHQRRLRLSGYTCNTTLGICVNPATPCKITNDCGGASRVCVAGACVPRSNGGSCPPGDSWVQNGCIPSQSAQFTCKTDGEAGVANPPAGVCLAGSICLHHSCYDLVRRDADAERVHQPAHDQQVPIGDDDLGRPQRLRVELDARRAVRR